MTTQKKKTVTEPVEDVLKITFGVEGLTPLMGDMFWSMEKKQNDTRPPEQKLYYDPRDGKTLVIPAKNWKAFLASERGGCCAQVLGPDTWKIHARHLRGLVGIAPAYAPIYRNGQPITFEGFPSGSEYDPETGIYVDHDNGWAGEGHKKTRTMLHRPVISTPWHIPNIELTVFPNSYGVNEALLRRYFEEGGLMVAIMNHRPEYGRFRVVDWKRV